MTAARRMEARPVGRTDIELSVIGVGTAQLQMLPERQAVEALTRAFESGVSWVHTAPDYGGVEPWIAEAARRSGREITLAVQGPGPLPLLEPYLDGVCSLFGVRRLGLYGLGCIDDLERIGENVWGGGGMVEVLQRLKSQGRVGALFCSTHGSPAYVEKLIRSGVFDAVMLAWNPLGFHLLTYLATRDQREFEDIPRARESVFPLAERAGVSLLVMKALGGGLLCRGRGLPPHEWFADPEPPIDAADLLRLALAQPGVCAVLPGISSAEEAEEVAAAGRAPLDLPEGRREAILGAAARMRLRLCSRCGACEPTCSRALPVASLLRDAYIWSYRTETFMADDRENHFEIHPSAEPACATCSERSCACPQGIDVPEALLRAHARVRALAASGAHPGPLAGLRARAVEGTHRLLVRSREVPAEIEAGAAGVARFLVENAGDAMWAAFSHLPDARVAVGVGVVIDGELRETVPLRQNVSSRQRSPIALEVRAPQTPGVHELRLYLKSLAARDVGPEATLFHSSPLAVRPRLQSRAKLLLASLLARLRGPRARPARTPPLASSRAAGTAEAYAVSWVDHTIPARLASGTTVGVRVTLRNTGALTWRAGSADGHPVEVAVFVDEVVYAVLKLPRPEVPSGESVTLHFALRAPGTVGAHRVRVEPVHQHVTWFGARGAAPLTWDLEVEASTPSANDAPFAVALRHNPWYFQPTQGIARSRDGRTFPLFVTHARGCRVTDAEGRQYLDYTMGWGATLLGHAEERVQAAVRAMLDTAPIGPFPHPVEMEVTQELMDAFPGAEMAVFGKNGSDACTVAARMARLVTGRPVILSCGFHGWQDFALGEFPFEASGIPREGEPVLRKFRFNDRDGFLRLFAQHRSSLAAIMIEPAGPAGPPEVGLEPDADPEFLRLLAACAREAGALLVFDEIVTAFRYRRGSVQRATGVVPDLTCLGKALASGYPLAAVLGPGRVFFEAFPRTHYCPTFKGEAYSFAAARAALRIYRQEPVAEHVWSHGERLQTGVRALCRELVPSAECKGPPFRMGLHFSPPDPLEGRLQRTLFMQELLKEGVITVNGIMLPSYAHDERALAEALAAIESALRVVGEAARAGDYDRQLEIPLL